MEIEYSKAFTKEVKKLNGKELQSVREMVSEIKKAKHVKELTDCKKLTGYKNIYRIRVGDYRAFFFVEIRNSVLYLQYFVSRGEAYKKKMREKLQEKDKEAEKKSNKL